MTVKVSEADFIDTWNLYQSPSEVARNLGLTLRATYNRRNRLLQKGVVLNTRPTADKKHYERTQTFDKRRELEVRDGMVVVYSDAHFWPGEPSLAFLALVKLIRELQPKAIIANGDLLDGARISRHEPRGWQATPTVKEEIAVLVERQDEIRQAAGQKCRLYRTLGNHDVRFERYIAIHAPELSDLKGTSLEDFIPDWPCSWSVAINNNTLVKHRWKGGVHSSYQNVVQSGWSFAVGHDHSMQVRPFVDLRNEIRFGIDTGCLADPDHDAFDYVEDNPRNWHSGFGVLTYSGGKLLWPDLCYVAHGRAWFRGAAVL